MYKNVGLIIQLLYKLLVIINFSFVQVSHSKELKENDLNSQLIEAIDAFSSNTILDGAVRIRVPNKLDLQKFTNEKIDSDTEFEWGSITKSLTAIALMKLVEDKRISLNSHVQEILPNFRHGQIKVSHLLNHSSGLPMSIPPYFYKEFTNIEIVSHSNEIPLQFSPGSSSQYSNIGYVYLRIIIETLTDKKLPEVLSDFGLHNKFTQNGVDLNIIKGFTLGANDNGTLSIILSPNAHSKTIWGASGAYGTIEELDELVSVIKEEKLLEQKSWKLMKEGIRSHGYGMRIDQVEGKNRISHTGRIDGFHSVYEYYPESGTTIVGLFNNDKSERNALLAAIRNTINGNKYRLPPSFNEMSVPGNLSKYLGRYKTKQFEFKIIEENGNLFVESHNDPKIELFFYSHNKLYSKIVDLQIIFDMKDKKVIGANFKYYGQDNLGNPISIGG